MGADHIHEPINHAQPARRNVAMKTAWCVVTMLVLLSSAAFAEDIPSYQLEATWLKCSNNSQCIAVEDGYCHIARTVNKDHLNAWKALDQENTRKLQADTISDYCGKDGTVNPTLAEVQAMCKSGTCVLQRLIPDNNASPSE